MKEDLVTGAGLEPAVAEAWPVDDVPLDQLDNAVTNAAMWPIVWDMLAGAGIECNGALKMKVMGFAARRVGAVRDAAVTTATNAANAAANAASAAAALIAAGNDHTPEADNRKADKRKRKRARGRAGRPMGNPPAPGTVPPTLCVVAARRTAICEPRVALGAPLNDGTAPHSLYAAPGDAQSKRNTLVPTQTLRVKSFDCDRWPPTVTLLQTAATATTFGVPTNAARVVSLDIGSPQVSGGAQLAIVDGLRSLTSKNGWAAAMELTTQDARIATGVPPLLWACDLVPKDKDTLVVRRFLLPGELPLSSECSNARSDELAHATWMAIKDSDALLAQQYTYDSTLGVRKCSAEASDGARVRPTFPSSALAGLKDPLEVDDKIAIKVGSMLILHAAEVSDTEKNELVALHNVIADEYFVGLMPASRSSSSSTSSSAGTSDALLGGEGGAGGGDDDDDAPEPPVAGVAAEALQLTGELERLDLGEYVTAFSSAGYLTVASLASLDEDALEELAEEVIHMLRQHRKGIFYPWAKALGCANGGTAAGAGADGGGVGDASQAHDAAAENGDAGAYGGGVGGEDDAAAADVMDVDGRTNGGADDLAGPDGSGADSAFALPWVENLGHSIDILYIHWSLVHNPKDLADLMVALEPLVQRGVAVMPHFEVLNAMMGYEARSDKEAVELPTIFRNETPEQVTLRAFFPRQTYGRTRGNSA